MSIARTLRRAGGAFILASLVAAAPAADAAPKGRVTVALASDASTHDPHMHTERMGIIMHQHLFNTLLARDTKTWQPVPHLAESVKGVNPLTWELKLRKGVKFHNGEPFGAESVKFSFERVLNPEQKSPIRGNFTWIKSVDVVDEHTVRILTTKPYPLIQEILTFGNFGMVPPKYIKEKGDANFAKNPVGTGPFKFVEWRKGERTVMEANERYWKGAPAIKTLTFRVIPEAATQIAELLSGGVDIIRAVPPDQIPAIERSGTARVTATKILRVVYLQLDGDGRAGKGPLTDVRVRRAINHAVNVDEIMGKVLGGKAVRSPNGNNPMVFGYDPTTKPYAFDPAQAKKLLAEAGFPAGFPMRLDCSNDRYINDGPMCEAISGMLRKVGIEATPNPRTKAVFFPALDNGDFTVYQAGWGTDTVGPTFSAVFHTQDAKKGVGRINRGRYSNKEVDALIAKASSEMDDAKRQAMWEKAWEIVIGEVAVLPLYQQEAIIGVQKNVQLTPRFNEWILAQEITLAGRN